MRLPKAVRALVEAAHQAPSADNTQPCRYVWTGQALEVHYDRQRTEGQIFDAQSLATQITVGAVLENVSQLAGAIGLTPQWEPIDRAGPRFISLRIDSRQADQLGATAASHPLFARHTNRWPYREQPLPIDLLSRVQGLQQGPCRLVCFSQRGHLRQLARLTQLASEARFQTPEVHRWLDDSLRLTREERRRDDGLALETLGMPPGGKQLLMLIRDWGRMARLNRLGAFKLLAQIESRPIQQGPAILAVVGPADGTAGLEAGQLMQRCWVELNQCGVAVHPGFVVPDQLDRLRAQSVPQRLRGSVEALRQDTQQLLGNAGETPYMLLRVGYPTRKAEFARRLPLQDVCDAWSSSTINEQPEVIDALSYTPAARQTAAPRAPIA